MDTVTRSEQQNSVVVVGGSGAVGRLLVDLLRGDGVQVTVVDARAASTSVDAATLVGDITAPDHRVTAALSTASTIVLAVPESVA
ncbi:MAG: NAD-dependent epimerase/dehydratase family protein, partial [Rhodococcus sp.]